MVLIVGNIHNKASEHPLCTKQNVFSFDENLKQKSTCSNYQTQLFIFGCAGSLLWRVGCGAQVKLSRGMSSWTRDGLCAPVLASGFLTNGPPGKSLQYGISYALLHLRTLLL